MSPDQLLNDLGLTAGIPSLQFDDRGCARLMFDGRLAVNFENDSDAGCIHLYTPVAPLPPDGLEALCKTLLVANLFGEQTLGATLAIDDIEHEIILCRCVPVHDATGKAFADILERFVAAAEDWTHKLGSGMAQTPLAHEVAPVSMPPLGLFDRA